LYTGGALPDNQLEAERRSSSLDLVQARRFDMMRWRIARVNASLASRSALRGIDPRDPPPKCWQLSTRRARVRDDAGGFVVPDKRWTGRRTSAGHVLATIRSTPCAFLVPTPHAEPRT
jgi:hypothetical protein